MIFFGSKSIYLYVHAIKNHYLERLNILISALHDQMSIYTDLYSINVPIGSYILNGNFEASVNR